MRPDGVKSSRLPQDRTPDGRFTGHATRYSRAWASQPPVTSEAALERKERGLIGQILTDAMGGISGRYNLLALVPGRPLFNELGRAVPSAQEYLRINEEMDSVRDEAIFRTDDVAQAWRKILSKDGASNRAMMDLMHDATRDGPDPSMAFKVPPRGARESESAHLARVADKRTKWSALRKRFLALPPEFQQMFRTVRDGYLDQNRAFEAALMGNISKAMQINLDRAIKRHTDTLREIEDDGLTGPERQAAIDAADAALSAARGTNGWGKASRLRELRLKFESNRVEGVYFPLTRFGNYFVTLRDADGKVTSFARFENERDQQRAIREAREIPDVTVSYGTLDQSELMKAQIDPTFVADVEQIIGDSVRDPAVMDAIWQRWLETLPDLSRASLEVPDSVVERALGTVVFSGIDDSGKLYFTGGALVNPLTGQFEGPPVARTIAPLARRAANIVGGYT